METAIVTETEKKHGALRWQELVTDIVVYLYIALYFYTAYEKLKNHGIFENSLQFSELLGFASAVLSWLVPIVEIGIGILLIVPRTKLWGIRAATALMLLFTLYLIYMLAFAKARPCECGGFISELTWKWHLVFNTVFVLLGAVAWRLAVKHRIYNP